MYVYLNYIIYINIYIYVCLYLQMSLDVINDVDASIWQTKQYGF